MTRRKTVTVLFITLCALLSFTTSSFAHKVRIFGWLEAGKIRTESKFSGGKAARNMNVVAIGTESGKELASGTTDVNGHFNFDAPTNFSEGLKITVQGADGHKGSWIFEATELSNIPAVEHTHTAAPQHLTQHIALKDSETLTCVSQEELSEIIEASLEKKLAPLRRSLAENSEKKTTLQDILGGIGYLLGLAGIAAYIKNRKESKE